MAWVADIHDGVGRIQALLDSFEPHTMDPIVTAGDQ
jgi:hypothetical protein